MIGRQKIFLESGLNTKILGNLRNINYEVKNVDNYKEDTTSELFGALGIFSKISLQKIEEIQNIYSRLNYF